MKTRHVWGCLLNQPRHFDFFGVPKTMNPSVLVKFLLISVEKRATSQRTNPQTSPNSAKILTFGKLRLKGNSFADIGEIGGNKEKSQDMTYAHFNFALFRDFGIISIFVSARLGFCCFRQCSQLCSHKN